MDDKEWKEIREKAAMDAIKQAKESETGKDLTEIESEILWKNKQVRDEFSDFETLVSFLKNESRTSSHRSKAENYSNEDLEAANNEEKKFIEMGREELKKQWDSDPALQAEYDGDYEAYLAFEKNKHRVKVLNHR